MNSKVYVVPCERYSEAKDKLRALVDLMGGMDRFVKPGEKILLKVNLLRGAPPEEAVTTHPAVVAAVAGLIKTKGAQPRIADSPGHGYRYTPKVLNKIYSACGMLEAAEQTGADINLDVSSGPVSYPEGLLTKRFDVIKPVLEADAVFNLCKMKTHLFTGMTGAVKNIFGVIPGLSKSGYHAKLHDARRFAGMLLDLAAFVSPRLSIMDAVLAMEGNGPGTGDPRRVGLLMGSVNPLALDVIAGEIMGLNRALNPVIQEAEKRGLKPTRPEEVAVVGADLSAIRNRGFRLPDLIASDPLGFGPLPWYQRIFTPIVKDAMAVKPRVNPERCVACGACSAGCPMNAVSFPKGSAFIDDKKCIRCYCCHEMCPEKAIGLHRSLLYRLIKPIPAGC